MDHCVLLLTSPVCACVWQTEIRGSLKLFYFILFFIVRPGAELWLEKLATKRRTHPQNIYFILLTSLSSISYLILSYWSMCLFYFLFLNLTCVVQHFGNPVFLKPAKWINWLKLIFPNFTLGKPLRNWRKQSFEPTVWNCLVQVSHLHCFVFVLFIFLSFRSVALHFWELVMRITTGNSGSDSGFLALQPPDLQPEASTLSWRWHSDSPQGGSVAADDKT